MEAMGGQAAFDSVDGVRFDFAFSRDGEQLGHFSHWWNRSSGEYRVTGMDRETQAPFDVRFNVGTRTGTGTLDGVALEGEALSKWLESGYGRFINDTYWFLMPWKWLDPGVTLGFDGEREVNGELCDVVTLKFGDGIGLTSNDRYWGYVSKETHRLVRWEYVLQDADGNPGTGEPTTWDWTDWQKTDAGILVSTAKRKVGEGPQVVISFPVLELSTASLDETTWGD